MVELDDGEAFEVLFQLGVRLLKVINFRPHVVLLLQHILPDFVQCVVVDLEDILYFLLVRV